jgi:hypothetical protein
MRVGLPRCFSLSHMAHGGSWEVCVSSRSSWIPLPVSPPFGAPKILGRKFTSSIKASVIIYFSKNSPNDCLGIDPHSDSIRQLRRDRYSNYKGPNWSAWKNNILVTKALKGSSIAAVSLSDTPTALHVFYQDPELHIRNIFMRTHDTGLFPSYKWYHGA